MLENIGKIKKTPIGIVQELSKEEQNLDLPLKCYEKGYIGLQNLAECTAIFRIVKRQLKIEEVNRIKNGDETT